MSKDRVLEPVLRELERVGIGYVATLNKHWKICFQIGEKEFKYVVPASASDNRSRANCVAGMRRLLRANGVTLSNR